jgi:ADP-ribosylglycohydrolase
LTQENRIELAKKSLLGVSIGDAFGESFFGEANMVIECIETKQIPETKWEFTDDTIMTLAIFEELENNGEILQDNLIEKFCKNHDIDPNRGYGATLRRLLREIQNGESWQEVSGKAFDGQGSMGNGASMRLSPIGAYHFDNIPLVKELAIKSAETTHSNKEAVVGAVAIAVAASLTTRIKHESLEISSVEFIDSILVELPDSDTKSKISKSKSLSVDFHIESLKSILGNGTNMTAQDTVPFVIWCCSNNLTDFESGLWKAVSILGDRDTICAMVGGILIMSSDERKVPTNWTNSVERILESEFRTRT